MRRDNPQRRLEQRLAWLGGIIDGEGTITLIKRVGRGQKGYVPRISIVNTDKVILDEILDIMVATSLPHYVYTKKGKEHWKPRTEIVIAGIRRCNRAIPVLLPYLVGKRHRGELLQEFCRSRLTVSRGNARTSPREEMIADLIRQGVTNGPAPKRSTTTRVAPTD